MLRKISITGLTLVLVAQSACANSQPDTSCNFTLQDAVLHANQVFSCVAAGHQTCVYSDRDVAPLKICSNTVCIDFDVLGSRFEIKVPDTRTLAPDGTTISLSVPGFARDQSSAVGFGEFQFGFGPDAEVGCVDDDNTTTGPLGWIPFVRLEEILKPDD